MIEPPDGDLRAAFRDLAAATRPYVRPPGAALAEQRARGRIRTRRVVVGIVAALAILVPAVSIVHSGDSNSQPQPAVTDPDPTLPLPSLTIAVPGRPTSGPGELANATLSLSWPDRSDDLNCGGEVTFSGGETVDPSGPQLAIDSNMYFDVDRDGGLEILARIRCRTTEAMQLVAVEPGPTPTLLGTVLATGTVVYAEPTEGSDIATIGDYLGLADGAIQVDVLDRRACCGTTRASAVVQQRTYRWTGSSFEQVDGPTTFVADPAVARLDVTAPAMVVAESAAGFQTGTSTITITNHGPQAAPDVSVYIEHQDVIWVQAGGDRGPCDQLTEISALCDLGDLAPGQTVSLTVSARVADQYLAYLELPAFYRGRVEVRMGVHRYPYVTYPITVP